MWVIAWHITDISVCVAETGPIDNLDMELGIAFSWVYLVHPSLRSPEASHL